MDISEVGPNLFIASRFYPPDEDMPPVPVQIDVTTFEDELLTPEATDEIARYVTTTQLLRSQGYDVVLRCTAGRNRSAVVAALCLIVDGTPPFDAIQTIAEKRRHLKGGALSNTSFVDFLLDQAES